MERRVSQGEFQLLRVASGRRRQTLCSPGGWSGVWGRGGWQIRVARGEQNGRASDCFTGAGIESPVDSRGADVVLHWGGLSCLLPEPIQSAKGHPHALGAGMLAELAGKDACATTGMPALRSCKISFEFWRFPLQHPRSLR